MLSLENLPKDFYAPNLHSDNPVQRIEAYDHVITAATAWKGTLNTLLDEAVRERDAAADEAVRNPRPYIQDRVREWARCIQQIHEGVYNTNEGIHEHIESILYRPGLDRTQRFLDEAKKEREEFVRLRDEPKTTKPYRLKKGKKFSKAGPDNTLVRYTGGEIVELTPNQARNFASHFDPVDPPKRKEPITVDPDAEPAAEHTTEKRLKKRA